MLHARPSQRDGILTRSAPLILLLLGALVGLGCRSSSECTSGAPGCVCSSDGDCEGGAVCRDGLCEAAMEVSVRVGSREARACEILFTDADSRVVGAIFDGDAVGTHVREAPRTAVTFAAGGDAPFGASDIRLVVIGTGAEAVQITSSACFDAAGAPLSDAAITVGG